jgi:hypothetical protein
VKAERIIVGHWSRLEGPKYSRNHSGFKLIIVCFDVSKLCKRYDSTKTKESSCVCNLCTLSFVFVLLFDSTATNIVLNTVRNSGNCSLCLVALTYSKNTNVYEWFHHLINYLTASAPTYWLCIMKYMKNICNTFVKQGKWSYDQCSFLNYDFCRK